MAMIFDSYMNQQDPQNSGSLAFKSDVKERRALVPSAHKKPKKSGCVLLSDYLTTSQKKGLNGPIETYNLNEPVQIGEFKKFPQDLKKKYLNRLLHEMGVTSSNIAKMMGTSPRTLVSIMESMGISKHPRGYKMNSLQKKKWEEFTKKLLPSASYSGPASETKKEDLKKDHEEKEVESTEKPEVKSTTKVDFRFSNLSIEISAKSWADIAEILKDLNCPLPNTIQINIS